MNRHNPLEHPFEEIEHVVGFVKYNLVYIRKFNICPIVVVIYFERHICSMSLAVPRRSNLQISSLQPRIRVIFSSHVS